MKLLFSLLVLALALIVSPWAYAANSPIVNRIKSTGVISIGYRPSSVPFSYLNNKGKPIGYSIDICTGIVNKLKKDLDMPNLKIKLVQATPATRIPLIANGTTNLSCGSTMNDRQREKLASFTPSIFYVKTGRFASLKKNHLSNLKDLKGKTIVSTAGSSEVKIAHELNKKYNLNMNITTTQTHAAGFLSVAHGRAAAQMLDDVLLAGLVASSHNPSAWQITGKAHGAEVYGIIEPKGATTFNNYVNQALTEMMKNGKVTKLYKKWFTQPIPPDNINLNWPMSSQLKWAFAHPSNCPYPLYYGSASKLQECKKSQNVPNSWVPR